MDRTGYVLMPQWLLKQRTACSFPFHSVYHPHTAHERIPLFWVEPRIMIEAIYLAPSKREPLQTCDFANVIAFQGLAGDRYCRKSVSSKYNVSFMAVEQIELFNRRHGAAIAWSAARRNIMTRGVNLNALVGVEFRIGNVWFRGEELCQPCALMARCYRDSGLNQRALLKEMMGRSGIRATALNDGIIEIDMPIVVD